MNPYKLQSIRIIKPDSRMRDNVISAVKYLLNEIWTFRSHIKIIFIGRFRASYSGTGLGIFWNYALPLIPLTVYWLLSVLRVFPNFEGVSGATYITFGVTLWFFLAGCIQNPIQVINSRNKESMKTSFPLSASIISEFARLMFDSIIRVFFVLAIVFFTESWPTIQALFLPLVLLPALLLFTGLGLLLGILNVIFNDISRIVTILLQYGIFVSGVIFPLNNAGMLSIFNIYNPFLIFIEASRSVVFQGNINNFNSYIIASVFAGIVFLFAIRTFYIMEYRLRGIN